MKFNSSQVSSAAFSPLASRKSILALSSNSQPSDEEFYRHSFYSSGSSLGSTFSSVSLLSPVTPLPKADNTKDCIIKELQKENVKLKNRLQELSIHNEELKVKNEQYKSKIKTLEDHIITLGLRPEGKESCSLGHTLSRSLSSINEAKNYKRMN